MPLLEETDGSSFSKSWDVLMYGSVEKRAAEDSLNSVVVRRANCSCYSSKLFKVVLAATTTGSFLFGFNISLLNSCISTIAADFQWCGTASNISCNAATWRMSVINSGVFMGAAVGALTSGHFLVIGCRRLLCCVMLLSCIGVYSSVTSDGAMSLTAARLIVGYVTGSLTVVVPTYISEISPPNQRGFFGTLHQLFCTIGNFIAILLGVPLTSVATHSNSPGWKLPEFDRIWWRVMLGVGLIPSVAAVILFSFVYAFDTPYYYVKHRMSSEAFNVLRDLRASEDVSEEIHSIERIVEEPWNSYKTSLRSMLTSRRFAPVLLFASVFSVGQQFVGINGFMSASNHLFADVGVKGSLVTFMSCIAASLQIFMCFPAMALIERTGRRNLMIFGLVGMLCAVSPGAVMLWFAPNAAATVWTAIIGAFVFIIFFGMSYGPICWIYIFEIFPNEIKDSASGIATCVHWLGASFVVFFSTYWRAYATYVLFAMIQFVCLIVVLLFMRESKGARIGASIF